MKEWFKRHKKLVIFLVIILLIAGGITSCIAKVKKTTSAVLESLGTQTDSVQKRDISEYISCSGTIISNDSVTVSSTTSGVEILSINVEAGDYVNEGDVIATLDTSDFEDQLADAKRVAEVNQANSDLSYANSIITYQQQDHTKDKTIHNNDDALDSAMDSYEAAFDAYNEAAISFSIAKLNFDQVDSDWQYSDDIAEKKAYQQALLNYQQAEHAYSQAHTRLERASDKYDYTEDEKPLNDRDAQYTLQQNANTLFQSMNTHSIAGINDQQSIRTISQKIENGTIKAPVSGYITSVNATEGSTYAGSGIVVIEDLSKLRVSANISEYDITSVRVGQNVVIKTNATGKQEMQGVVAEIAPRSTKAAVTQGQAAGASTSVSYNVIIDILDPIEGLKLDMSAKLKIMVSEVKDVLSVPFEAVQEDEEGYYVEVVDNPGVSIEEASKNKGSMPSAPESHKVYVTKGAEGSVYVEISGEGISEGVVVIVPVSDEMGNDIFSMMGGF